MNDKISVQQRKYFVERIENSINDKIDELKQSNAAEVQNISEINDATDLSDTLQETSKAV